MNPNLEWLKRIWGPPADNFLIRGTPYNQGKVLARLIDLGVESVGDPTQGHFVAIDARAPKFDGGIVTRLDCVSLGIVINKYGDRFYDEGEDFWPKRYAIWGRLVAQQPDQIGYCILDSKAMGKFSCHLRLSTHGSARASAALAQAHSASRRKNSAWPLWVHYNDAVQPGTFDHTILDNCKTSGLYPEKTHWAVRIESAALLCLWPASWADVHLSRSESG